MYVFVRERTSNLKARYIEVYIVEGRETNNCLRRRLDHGFLLLQLRKLDRSINFTRM